MSKDVNTPESLPLKLVHHFGSISNAARALGLYRQIVKQWIDRGLIPTHYALEVERATDAEIRAREILEEYERKVPKRVSEKALAQQPAGRG